MTFRPRGKTRGENTCVFGVSSASFAAAGTPERPNKKKNRTTKKREGNGKTNKKVKTHINKKDRRTSKQTNKQMENQTNKQTNKQSKQTKQSKRNGKTNIKRNNLGLLTSVSPSDMQARSMRLMKVSWLGFTSSNLIITIIHKSNSRGERRRGRVKEEKATLSCHGQVMI